MGGQNSGRNRVSNVASIECARILDIRCFRKLNYLRLGFVTQAAWSWRRNNENNGSVNLIFSMPSPSQALIQIDFSLNGARKHQEVALDAVTCRYGGYRFYFICPASGRRCEVLALLNGYFACRQHHRLTYASQSETALDRMGRRVRRLEAQAKGFGRYRCPRGAKKDRLLTAWLNGLWDWESAIEAEGMRRFGRLF